MKQNIFQYIGKNLSDLKVFLIKVKNMGESFSTEHWRKNKVQKNQCPCCLEMIE